jgi:hypothetical protein
VGQPRTFRRTETLHHWHGTPSDVGRLFQIVSDELPSLAPGCKLRARIDIESRWATLQLTDPAPLPGELEGFGMGRITRLIGSLDMFETPISGSQAGVVLRLERTDPGLLIQVSGPSRQGVEALLRVLRDEARKGAGYFPWSGREPFRVLSTPWRLRRRSPLPSSPASVESCMGR